MYSQNNFCVCYIFVTPFFSGVLFHIWIVGLLQSFVKQHLSSEWVKLILPYWVSRVTLNLFPRTEPCFFCYLAQRANETTTAETRVGPDPHTVTSAGESGSCAVTDSFLVPLSASCASWFQRGSLRRAFVPMMSWMWLSSIQPDTWTCWPALRTSRPGKTLDPSR